MALKLGPERLEEIPVVYDQIRKDAVWVLGDRTFMLTIITVLFTMSTECATECCPHRATRARARRNSSSVVDPNWAACSNTVLGPPARIEMLTDSVQG